MIHFHVRYWVEATGIEPALGRCKVARAAINTKPPIWAEGVAASSALFLSHGNKYSPVQIELSSHFREIGDRQLMRFLLTLEIGGLF
jgi:hypothetical protein